MRGSVKCPVCGEWTRKTCLEVEKTSLVRVTREAVVCPDCTYQRFIGDARVEYVGPTKPCPVCESACHQEERSVFEVDDQGREARYFALEWVCSECLYEREVERVFLEYSKDTPGNEYRAMVSSPGKYEGESPLVPWIWQEIVLHGGGYTVHLYGGSLTTVEVDSELRDRAEYLFTRDEADLEEIHMIALEEVESGFVHARFFEEEEWDEFTRGME